jgi:hypothetical protein
MASTPIYNWPTPDNTDLVKNGALAIRTLGDAIDTTMDTMIPETIFAAKGDLLGASANDTPAVLTVGADGETLVADSSTSTGLAYKSAATLYPWVAYTPSFNGITIGNGTVDARYQVIGKTVNFYLRVILGTTSSVSSRLSATLPVNSRVSVNPVNGFFANTVAIFMATPFTAGNLVYIDNLVTNGTYAAPSDVSSTTPFTWATGFGFYASGTYEAV